MERIINSLSELTRPQVQALLDNVKIQATGTYTPPPLDLEAIKARADELDPQSQAKADMYLLILEVERLTDAS